MRRTQGLLLASVMVVGLSLPAQALPPAVLVLSGSSTAFVDVTLPTDVRLDTYHATTQTRGRFSGMYAEPLGESDAPARSDDDRHAGVLILTELHSPATPPEPLVLTASSGLSAGRYRIYLIADGPSTVRIPMTGMASRRLTPTRRTTARLNLSSLKPNLVHISGREPLTVARRSLSLSTLLVGDFQEAFVGRIGTCLTARGTACSGQNLDGAWTGYVLAPTATFAMGWSVVYLPGIHIGPIDAVQEAANATGIDYGIGAGFTLTLV